MGVTKYKPQCSPRTLEMRASQVHGKHEKAMQSAREAVVRSRELIQKTKEIVASSQELAAKKRPPLKLHDTSF